MEKVIIECAVKGQRRPGFMCGSIIVGNKTCGFQGGCEHQRNRVDSVYMSPERVEKTAKSIHNKSTNLCQNSTELVETAETISSPHRYAGSFGD